MPLAHMNIERRCKDAMTRRYTIQVTHFKFCTTYFSQSQNTPQNFLWFKQFKELCRIGECWLLHSFSCFYIHAVYSVLWADLTSSSFQPPHVGHVTGRSRASHVLFFSCLLCGSQTYQAAVAILKPSCSCCDCWQYHHSVPCHSSLGGLQGAQVAV